MNKSLLILSVFALPTILYAVSWYMYKKTNDLQQADGVYYAAVVAQLLSIMLVLWRMQKALKA